MPNITNVSQRLVNTHDGVAIPPGATVEISAEAANNETILAMIDEGVLATAPLHETDNPTSQEQKRPDQPSPEFNTGPRRDQDKTGERRPEPTQLPAQPNAPQPNQRPAGQQPVTGQPQPNNKAG